MNEKQVKVYAAVSILLFHVSTAKILASPKSGLAKSERSSENDLTEDSIEKVLPHVQFCDKLQPGSANREDIRDWTSKEKKIVLSTIARVNDLAPELFERATAFSPIYLYRTPDNAAPPAASYPAFLYTPMAEMSIGNDFFETEKRATFGRIIEYKLFVMTHELTHMADTGHTISRSVEWKRLVANTLESNNMALKFFRLPEEMAWDKGVPSTYATRNEREALAEYTSALLLAKSDTFKMSPEIEKFVREKMLSKNFKPDLTVKYCFEGHQDIQKTQGRRWASKSPEQKESKRTLLNQALAHFQQALDLDPNCGDAKLGKQLVEMKLKVLD